MANTYTSLIIHFIWSTKQRASIIPTAKETSLWAYLAKSFNNTGCRSIQIGGMPNHIHALVDINKNSEIPILLKQIKGSSSTWMNSLESVGQKFQWQDGYSAFSVSPSKVKTVAKYIQEQKEHHAQKTFEVEYEEFLRKHQITYDRQYMLGLSVTKRNA